MARRQQANAHVLNGNADECARALDLAFQHAADAPHDPTDVARYCTPSWVEMEAAHCWVALGKPTKAITTLQQSLADWRPDFRRDLGVCLTRLAVAHASAEQPEYALAVAEHALPIAVDTGSHRAARELRRLPGLLAAAGADEHAARTRQALTALR